MATQTPGEHTAKIIVSVFILCVLVLIDIVVSLHNGATLTAILAQGCLK